MLKNLYFITAFVSVLFVFACQKKDTEASDRGKSTASVQKFNPYPGTVVFEVNDPISDYTAQSPSIVVLPNGNYLISFFYDGGTSVYVSKDKGKTWQRHSRVSPSNFATLFEHRGDLYLMGTSKGGRGDVAIYKSTDQGKTWSFPTDESNGLLFQGMFHTAPVPVVKYNGKIWRAYEEIFDSAESRDFYAFAVCADEDADLLKASSWQRTNSLRFDESWINARRPNWLEGNIVVTPEGKLINFMRLETWPGSGVSYQIQGAASGKLRHEVAAFLDIDAENMTVEFKNEPRNYVHFPGAESKFTIRYDPVSESYWTIANKITTFVNTTGTHDLSTHQRNVLVLMRSTDLVNWEVKQKILKWNEGAKLKTWDTFGFQYVDWQFEGEDIVFASRTSWYGKRYHDANMITFHRIENFRNTSSQEPEDLLKYTQHPKLFDIPATAIKNGSLKFQGLALTISVGEGIHIDGDGKITLKNQLISNDETQAMKAYRYIDFKLTHDQSKDFSVETLDFTTIANTNAFRIKWLYSTDGVTFHPITNYLLNIESSAEGVKFTPPLYLPVYKGLHTVDGDKGVILRCAIVRGNGTGIYMKFDDKLSIGGRVLP